MQNKCGIVQDIMVISLKMIARCGTGRVCGDCQYSFREALRE